MPSLKDAIVIEGLVKKFGSTVALDEFDMRVASGEVHGFVGPNGAGKSTTIRILLGLARATSGKVRLFGGDPWNDAVDLHAKLAYVSGDVNLWPNLTGGEIIDLLGSMRGSFDLKRRDRLVGVFDLDTSKKFRSYSKGNRQKVALVAALACDVPLYILDEPTSGLDPLMEKRFQQEINELKSKGKTVLLSSHILTEVERLCDRATVIREGKAVATYTIAELKANHKNLEELFLDQYGEE